MTARQKRLLAILICGVPTFQIPLREALWMWRCERDGTWPETGGTR